MILVFTIESCDERYQFTCNSGKCIDKSLRCDGRADCFDETDEVGCSEPGRLLWILIFCV